MHYIFSHFKGWFILLIFILISIGVTYVIFKICRKRFPAEMLSRYKDATGIYVSMIGVLYGVLLAFIVVAVWEHYEGVKQNIQQEADALGNLYSDSQVLPPKIRDRIDSTLKNYVNLVITKEWKMLEKYQESEEAVNAEYHLQYLITHMSTENPKASEIYDQMVTNLNIVSAARRSRVSETSAEMPPVIWYILIAGAFILLIYLSCFYIENLKFQLWLGYGVSALIALVLFVCLDLYYPFTGSTRIDPDSFKHLLDHTISHIDSFEKLNQSF